MSYIGAEPTTAAFPFDQFSGTGAATSFTLTYAPASATSILVAISGVMQNPNLYSVIGTTLSFSPAPPVGTNNISVLYLGLPVIGSSSPGNTAFLSSTDLTATAGQTVFASAGSYTPGFVQVFRNGARLGNADFTATNGTTITLANAAAAGDLVTIEYYTLTSLVNALPLTGGTVTGSTTFNSAVNINGAAVSGFTGMKNRIINGNMVVDQRNAGASVTSGFPVDRWSIGASQASKFSAQRNAGSVTPPAGFANYLGMTSSSAYSVTSTDYFFVSQIPEGFNASDFAWGSASAAPVTLSFRVYSSLTGTFGGCIKNGNANRSYPFSYTVSSANTWTTISVTIPGDTTGTWATDNSAWGYVIFSLGSGSTRLGTANTWSAANYDAPTGSVSVVGTSGATFYITGVQLERGSNATSFEFIDYGRQLIQCQRYFEIIKKQDSGSETLIGVGFVYSNPNTFMNYPFKTTKRAEPTMTLVGSATSFQVLNTAGSWLQGTNVTGAANLQSTRINVLTSFSGMTAGQAAEVRCDNGGGQMWISAEL